MLHFIYHFTFIYAHKYIYRAVFHCICKNKNRTKQKSTKVVHSSATEQKLEGSIIVVYNNVTLCNINVTLT